MSAGRTAIRRPPARCRLQGFVRPLDDAEVQRELEKLDLGSVIVDGSEQSRVVAVLPSGAVRTTPLRGRLETLAELWPLKTLQHMLRHHAIVIKAPAERRRRVAIPTAQPFQLGAEQQSRAVPQLSALPMAIKILSRWNGKPQ
jgi:hypothetical protein